MAEGENIEKRWKGLHVSSIKTTKKKGKTRNDWRKNKKEWRALSDKKKKWEKAQIKREKRKKEPIFFFFFLFSLPFSPSNELSYWSRPRSR
jgi:hypothetical protein